MAERETVAATIAGAIIQGRSARMAAQAQLLNDPSVAAGSPTEAAEAVRLYLAVLNELDVQVGMA